MRLIAPIVLALALVSTSTFAAGNAEDVQAAMQLLKAKTAALGEPTVRGEGAVADKAAPALYFGTTKMNNDFAVTDAVQNEKGGTATLFVRNGDEFVRVSTNVKKPDGSRAIGTVLDPKGKAMAAIANGDSYYGDADILGKPYITGYEPIGNPGSNTVDQDYRGDKIIGIYYVGYPRE